MESNLSLENKLKVADLIIALEEIESWKPAQDIPAHNDQRSRIMQCAKNALNKI